MTIIEQLKCFEDQHGREIVVHGTTWRYYRLGSGTPILWLTGGLRRAGLGFAFMEKLAARHTVIAPDYPPVVKIDELLHAVDLMLQAEGIQRFTLGGQSYGGMLAQAYLAHRGAAVERLVLSSTGPSDWGKPIALVDDLFVGLMRLLPERMLKKWMLGGLLKFITVPEAERKEWEQALQHVLQTEISRADMVSHFAVAADLIRKGSIRPQAFRDWEGRVIVLAAQNDITQSSKDLPKYEKLLGRPVQVIDMGDMGHTAALFDPGRYVALLEKALEQ